jgi:hypothetical protein
MSAGYRSLSAFWLGGAGAVPGGPTTQAGFRSPLAMWMGGASAVSAASKAASYLVLQTVATPHRAFAPWRVG